MEQNSRERPQSDDSNDSKLPGTNRRTFLGAIGAGTALATLGLSGSSRPAAAESHSGSRSGIPPELPSAIEIDEENLEVTLPLFRGRGPGDETVYYVLTESSDLQKANKHGLNWAPKLKNALGTEAVQEVDMGNSDQFNPRNATNTFEGTVDFSPDRTVVPGPDGFPPRRRSPAPRATARTARSSRPTGKSSSTPRTSRTAPARTTDSSRWTRDG